MTSTKLAVREWLIIAGMVLALFGAIVGLYQRVSTLEAKVDVLVRVVIDGDMHAAQE